MEKRKKGLLNNPLPFQSSPKGMTLCGQRGVTLLQRGVRFCKQKEGQPVPSGHLYSMVVGRDSRSTEKPLQNASWLHPLFMDSICLHRPPLSVGSISFCACECWQLSGIFEKGSFLVYNIYQEKFLWPTGKMGIRATEGRCNGGMSLRENSVSRGFGRRSHHSHTRVKRLSLVQPAESHFSLVSFILMVCYYFSCQLGWRRVGLLQQQVFRNTFRMCFLQQLFAFALILQPGFAQVKAHAL